MTEMRSIYGELKSTGDYTAMTDEALLDRALYFAELEQSQEVSPRAKADIQKIIGRLTFEIMMRDQGLQDETA